MCNRATSDAVRMVMRRLRMPVTEENMRSVMDREGFRDEVADVSLGLFQSDVAKMNDRR
jgi:hypothetical protein